MNGWATWKELTGHPFHLNNQLDRLLQCAKEVLVGLDTYEGLTFRWVLERRIM
jgi:hypothetical protein